MNYDCLDSEELLRLALDAINAGRDADALVLLKTVLERAPEHVHAQYLMAAQHAQMGLVDRAEAGFRKVIAEAPEFPMPRFQLAQLLLMRGDNTEARELLAPITRQPDVLGAYARALAAADDDIAGALRELDAGLALPQGIPQLAADMQRVREQLAKLLPDGPEVVAVPAPMLLTGYGRASD